jgi:diacylglycerol O-acyltransferase
MEANYPLGPLAGTAFNLTTMSYRGWLFLGLVTDPAAVQDPEELLGELDAAYAELLSAGGVRRRRRP